MGVFQIPVGGALEINVTLTDSTATVIVDASLSAVFIPWFEVNENAGSTAALTVDIYDGTTARYLGDDAGNMWRAFAVTANKSYKFTQGYRLPKGSYLRVKSGDAAGKFTVHGLRIPTDQ